jgi:penicillin V acylase-like amidase (Ntn superfamily)
MERRHLFRLATSAALVPALSLAPHRQARGCTRVLWNSNGKAVIVGRTMDWPESTEPNLFVLPAGIKRDGGRFAGHTVIAENPQQWTAKYGSLVAGMYDLGAVDGVNERGLAGHLLYLVSTDFGPRDPKKPGLHAGLWLQYALDNAASVTEALALLAPVQIVMVSARGHDTSVHLALEDASGDSAIIEYLNGQAVVHHNRDYTILTNDPPFAEQMALLRQMEADPAFRPSRNTPLPGNVNPIARFQRAAFFARFLPEPSNTREAIAAMFSILANVSVPFGAPYDEFGTYNTEYRSVIDLTNLVYYFQLTTVPSVSWTQLRQLDFKQGAPSLVLNPDALDLTGDVTNRYRPVAAPF